MFLSKFSPKFGWQKIGAAGAVLGKSCTFLQNIHQWQYTILCHTIVSTLDQNLLLKLLLPVIINNTGYRCLSYGNEVWDIALNKGIQSYTRRQQYTLEWNIELELNIWNLPTILPEIDLGVMSIPCCMKAPNANQRLLMMLKWFETVVPDIDSSICHS